jgi:hypothetical protein
VNAGQFEIACGWRREVFGAQALALKHGAIALRLRNGQVETFTVEGPN